jgi:predicted Rdx family selenoprotein
MGKRPFVEITYCRLCGWGLRAGWMAQELVRDRIAPGHPLGHSDAR